MLQVTESVQHKHAAHQGYRNVGGSQNDALMRLQRAILSLMRQQLLRRI